MFGLLTQLSASGSQPQNAGFNHPAASPPDVLISHRLFNAVKAVVLHALVTDVIMYFVLVCRGLSSSLDSSDLDLDDVLPISGLEALLAASNSPDGVAPAPPALPPTRHMDLTVLGIVTSLCVVSSLVIWSASIARDLRLAAAACRDSESLALHTGREEQCFQRGLLSATLATVAFFKILVICDKDATNNTLEAVITGLQISSMCIIPLGTFAGFGLTDSFDNWMRALLGAACEGKANPHPLTFVESVCGYSFWWVLLAALASALFKPLDNSSKYNLWPAPLFLACTVGLNIGCVHATWAVLREYKYRLQDSEIRGLLTGNQPLNDEQVKYLLERHFGWMYLKVTGGIRLDQISAFRSLLETSRKMKVAATTGKLAGGGDSGGGGSAAAPSPPPDDADIEGILRHMAAEPFLPAFKTQTFRDIQALEQQRASSQQGQGNNSVTKADGEMIKAVEKRREKRVKKSD